LHVVGLSYVLKCLYGVVDSVTNVWCVLLVWIWLAYVGQ